MIVTDEEKVIFYNEISADSPVNNVVIRNLDFDKDEAYKFEWAINIKPLSREQSYVFIQVNGVRTAYIINQGGYRGSPNANDVPPLAKPDRLALGTGYETSSHTPTSGYITFYKHADPPNGYGHSFVGEKTHDDGHRYFTHIFGGTIDQTAIERQPITNIGFVGDTNGTGTATWYGWIKVSRV